MQSRIYRCATVRHASQFYGVLAWLVQCALICLNSPCGLVKDRSALTTPLNRK